MAKKEIRGFQFPYGLANPNKMYNADAYAGPYDTLEDALDTIVEELRIPGRKFGVYSDTDKKKVVEYTFELNEDDEWITTELNDTNKTVFYDTLEQALDDIDTDSRYVGLKFNVYVDEYKEDYKEFVFYKMGSSWFTREINFDLMNATRLGLFNIGAELGYNSFSTSSGNASGAYSIAMGRSTDALGEYSTCIGNLLSSNYSNTTLLGFGLLSSKDFQTIIGYNNTNSNASIIFSIGADETNKKNSLEIFEDGLILGVSQTNALIDADTTGKAVITKEYFQANASQADLSNYYNKSEIDNKVQGLYRFKGSVATADELPNEDLNIGDVYNVIGDNGMNYAWTGTEWDSLGVVLDLIDFKEEVISEITEEDHVFDGIVLMAPNGLQYKLMVDNDGSLITDLINGQT